MGFPVKLPGAGNRPHAAYISATSAFSAIHGSPHNRNLELGRIPLYGRK
jgi:hypothetical protein